MELPTKEGWYAVEYESMPDDVCIIHVVRQDGELGEIKEKYGGGTVFIRVEDMAVKWIKEMK